MITEVREAMLLNTLVFETLGQPEKEREFKLKSLKKWGFDLVFGKKDGEDAFFGVEEGKKVGDKFNKDDVEYEVKEILEKLPKNKKMFAKIEMVEGRAYLYVYLREDDIDTPILYIPAGEVLLAFLKKHKFIKIIEAIRNIGSAANLVKKHGDEGKPVSFEELPPVARRFLRDAKKIEKEMGFGRVALAYFGENKSGEARYWLEWMVPTIALFDEKISEKIDKALAEFK
ncbi:TIGR00703 family protein [Caminibacter mediatlanticus TB-2]|uniref:TIGR00703 family protein n=1 Tax=Caminibacter mediatlanticus TB-2 TaxID=391592 RepID=A0ABX5V750_9BACT|nr:TIGR00703 family protein [Caminibacter mediatlanticus]QCT94097.1 TIGR00703 family protein [Caminibacter mediatlanticus TB-2]